jgi:tetratricopeptide (TPR) repeat protein
MYFPRICFLLLIVVYPLLATGCKNAVSNETSEETMAAPVATTSSPADSIPSDIESRIDSAFIKTQIQQTIAPLQEIRQQLEKMPDDRWAVYWKNYVSYYEAIFHLVKKDKQQSQQVTEKAIQSMNRQKNKNTEDYAFLAMLQSFSAQFAHGMEAAIVAAAAKKNAEKALKLNTDNPRAYYVLGQLDFYTPEEYGGKKMVESYLAKAIRYMDKTPGNARSPRWGGNLTYELMIKSYLDAGNTTKARQYLAEGSAKFPGDYQLKKLSEKMQ